MRPPAAGRPGTPANCPPRCSRCTADHATCTGTPVSSRQYSWQLWSEGGREGGRDGGREGGRDGGMNGASEGGSEGGTEGWREGGREGASR